MVIDLVMRGFSMHRINKEVYSLLLFIKTMTNVLTNINELTGLK